MKRLYYIILLGILWGCSSDIVELPEEVVTDIPEISTPEVIEPIIMQIEEPTKDKEKDPILFYSTRASTDICKITDGLTDFRGPTGIGVDLKEQSIPSSGLVRIAVVYLDFADYRWNRSESTYELTSFLIDPINAYYNEMSRGTVHFEWVVFNEIISLPLRAEEYNITRGFDHERVDIKQVVVPMLEKLLNPNDWDAIIWGINPDVPEHIADVSPTSLIGGPDNSYFYHMALIGMDTRRNGYMNIAHEIGHMFGLPDLYVNVCYQNHLCDGGVVNWLLQFQYAGSWSLMSRADHLNNELKGWERFMIGWLDENEFHCVDTKEEHVIQLQSLNANSGIRMIGVSLSNYKNLIIELREQAPYCQTCQTGLLVYTVNTQRDLNTGYIHIVRPDHSIDITLEDALLLPIQEFNKVEYNGWYIELIDLYEKGVVVRLSNTQS